MLWGASEETDARTLLRRLLDGVGTGQTKISVVKRDSIALHAKRELSIKEKAALSAEWCALPAIDAEGDIAVLEVAEWS